MNLQHGQITNSELFQEFITGHTEQRRSFRPAHKVYGVRYEGRHQKSWICQDYSRVLSLPKDPGPKDRVDNTLERMAKAPINPSRPLQGAVVIQKRFLASPGLVVRTLTALTPLQSDGLKIPYSSDSGLEGSR